MRPELFAAVKSRLVQDTELAALLSSYGGAPAIFAGDAPEDAEMPYVVWSVVSDVPDNLVVDRLVLALDAFERSEKPHKVLAVLNRLENLLHGWSFAGVDAAVYSCIREYSDLLKDPEEGVWHGRAAFLLRIGRRDLARTLAAT